MGKIVRSICVFCGNKNENFVAGESVTFEEFAKEAFGIDDIFENKLVTGRYICHDKDSDADVSLNNQEDIERFIFSEDPTRLHIILINENLINAQETKTSANIVVSENEWEELVESVKELQHFMQTLRNTSAENKGLADARELQATVHTGVVCNFCDLGSSPFASEKKFIVGPRFKCLECSSFDLCSSCEARGVEMKSHRRHHNMVKINTPLTLGERFNTAISKGPGLVKFRREVVLINIFTTLVCCLVVGIITVQGHRPSIMMKFVRDISLIIIIFCFFRLISIFSGV